MVVRIKSSIHTDYGRWRAAVGKCADQNEICIVNPYELWIGIGIESFFSKGREDTLSHREVGHEGIIDIFSKMHATYWDLRRRWIHGDLDLVTSSCPMSTLAR